MYPAANATIAPYNKRLGRRRESAGEALIFEEWGIADGDGKFRFVHK
jgi:hypothetical protein